MQRQVNLNNPSTYRYANSSYLKGLKARTDQKITELYKEDLPKISLIDYAKEAWRIVVPKKAFICTWSIEAVAEHLEAVSKGEITRLIINIPPRHTKSLLCSVFWPTWEWTQNPYTQWLTLSYGLNLAIRDATKSRRVIQHEWYQKNWSKAFTFAFDQNVKSRYENNLQGQRLSSSMLASMTGENADRILIDDPHNVMDIESDTIRQATLDAYDLAISTRLNDPHKSAIVVIGQRTRENDLFGHLLANTDEKWNHLCLASENSTSYRCTTSLKTSKGKVYTDPVTGTFIDPRIKNGELLSPERFDQSALDKAKRTLGIYGYSAQHDQQPTPAGGALFKEKDFQYIKVEDYLKLKIVRKHRHWDLAATEKSTAAFTAGVLISVDVDENYYIEDVKRDQLTAGDIETLIVKTAREDGFNVSLTVEEEKGASGKYTTHFFKKLLPGFDIRGQELWADKVTRARALCGCVEAHKLFLVIGTWNKPYVSEMIRFPKATLKDQVDATSGGYREMIKNTSHSEFNGLQSSTQQNTYIPKSL